MESVFESIIYFINLKLIYLLILSYVKIMINNNLLISFYNYYTYIVCTYFAKKYMFSCT